MNLERLAMAIVIARPWNGFAKGAAMYYGWTAQPAYWHKR